MTAIVIASDRPNRRAFERCRRIVAANRGGSYLLHMLPELATSEILRIARSHGARTARVFGSCARREATAGSDLDLLVSLEPGRSLLDLVAIKQDLEDLLG